MDAVDESDDAPVFQYVVGVLYDDGEYTGTITKGTHPGVRNGSGKMKYFNDDEYDGQWKEDYRRATRSASRGKK